LPAQDALPSCRNWAIDQATLSKQEAPGAVAGGDKVRATIDA